MKPYVSLLLALGGLGAFTALSAQEVKLPALTPSSAAPSAPPSITKAPAAKAAATHTETEILQVIGWVMGKNSQVDTFDPKPLLNKLDGQKRPAEFGEAKYQFISNEAKLMGTKRTFKKYGQSGIEVSDLLPHIAECVDDLAVIRSCHGDMVVHSAAQYHFAPGRSGCAASAGTAPCGCSGRPASSRAASDGRSSWKSVAAASKTEFGGAARGSSRGSTASGLSGTSNAPRCSATSCEPGSWTTDLPWSDSSGPAVDARSGWTRGSSSGWSWPWASNASDVGAGDSSGRSGASPCDQAGRWCPWP